MISQANPQLPLNGNNVFSESDEHWLRHALKLAEKAAYANEVPVGAVLVAENKLLGEGFNRPISTNDPTAHAEIIALREAATRIQNYRLVNTTLYVTLEPCGMCMGAIIHARVSRLVFGALDARPGIINHKVNCQSGLLSAECSHLLSEFFKNKRATKI